MGFTIIGTKRDRGAIAIDGLLQSPETLERNAQACVGLGEVLPESERFTEIEHGLVEPLKRQADAAQQVPRVSPSGVVVEYASINFLGPPQGASLMKLQAFGEQGGTGIHV